MFKFFLIAYFLFISAFQTVTAGDPRLQPTLANALRSYIHDHGFSSAYFCIAKHGELIAEQVVGRRLTKKYYPLASLSKLITRIAISQLIRQKKISRSTQLRELYSLSNALDNRIPDITIGQLIDHTAGWDFSPGYDPLFNLKNLGLTEETPDRLAEILLSDYALKYTPGQYYVYSNVGYFILGDILQKMTGMTYFDYVVKNIGEPFKIALERAVTPQNLPRTPWLEGSFSLESGIASHGLAAKPADITTFFSLYHLNGKPILPEEASLEWWQTGSLPGTLTAIIRKRLSGVVISVFILDRDDNSWEEDLKTLKQLVDQVANRCKL